MNATPGAFIQYACAANQTATDDLFIKHLLTNIAQENVDISDVFNSVSNAVSRESKNKQRPLSINGLPKKKQIILNPLKSKSKKLRIIPRIAKLNE